MTHNAMPRNPEVQKPLSSVQKRIQQAALRLFAEKGVDGVNVKDLARSAKVARGTIYNNQRASIEEMFQDIASQFSAEMHQRVTATLADVDDPAERLAIGIRLFVRRAHREPEWGAFMLRFGMSNSSMRQMSLGSPREDVVAGIASGRFKLRPELMPTAMVMIATTVLGGIFLVLKAHRSWQKAGSDAAELTLRGLGVSTRAAQKIATGELPELAPVS